MSMEGLRFTPREIQKIRIQVKRASLSNDGGILRGARGEVKLALTSPLGRMTA